MRTNLRPIAFIMALILLIPQLALTSGAAVTTADITASMDYYKANVYKQDWYWDGGDINTSFPSTVCHAGNSGCTCNQFYGASQCHGFALYLAYLVIGSAPRRTLASYTNGATSNGWTCYTRSSLGTQGIYAVGLQPGDIIRAASDSSYASGHTALVWKIENGRVYFAECWGSRHCKLNWTGFNYYSYSLSDICSRYSYVAIWRNSSVVVSSETTRCSHNYVAGCDAEHPHAAYMICTKCGDMYYTGENARLDSCVCCTGVHDWEYGFEPEHPHAGFRICRVCGIRENTGAWFDGDIYDGCAECARRPYALVLECADSDLSPEQRVDVSVSASNADSLSVDVLRDGIIVRTFAGDEIAGGAFAYTPSDEGVYSLRLTAKKGDADRITELNPAFTVSLHAADVREDESYIYVRYSDPLSRTAAQKFCTARKGILFEYRTGSGFTLAIDRSYAFGTTDGSRGYELIEGGFSWDESRVIASALGSGLVRVDSAEENAAVADLLRTSGISSSWIDLTDAAHEGVWTRADGSSPDHLNWGASHGDEYDVTRNWACVYRSGAWNDSSISEGAGGFIIEYGVEFSAGAFEDGAVIDGVRLRAVTLPANISVPETVNGAIVRSVASDLLSKLPAAELTLPSGITYIDASALRRFDCVRAPKDSATANTLTTAGADWRVIIPFTDLAGGQWFSAAAEYCYAGGYLNGTSATTFEPNTPTTRAMIVTILAKMAGADTSQFAGATSFADVAAGSWYANAVEWAHGAGLAAGDGVNFNPSAPLTREQLATFMRAYAAFDGENTAAVGELSAYSDAQDVSAWAKDACAWAVARGLISGTSASTLAPKLTASRAQICVIVMKYLGD